MIKMKLSQSVEDYLETICLLEKEKEKVRVNDIATHLEIRPPSVTGAMKKLAEKGFIRYERYGPVELTKMGRKVGMRTYEKHKLLVKFFVLLGVDRKTALRDACLAEHVLSRKTIERLKRFVEKKGNAKK